MPADLTRLFAAPHLSNLSLAAVHVVMASRLCALCNIGGHAPLPVLTKRMGSEAAAAAILDLASAVGDIWVEPFMVGRPCCPTLTPDETAIAVLVSAAQIHDEASGLANLRELLPPEQCVALYRLARAAVDAIAAVPLKVPVSQAPDE
jgi:hypothetical protein